MRRSWLVWTGFLLCLAIVLAAMGWVSLMAVRLDRNEAAARRQAAVEEAVRLALWRADSTLAPLVAQESVRPWFAYRAFLPVDRAYANLFNGNNDNNTSQRVVTSPLLAETLPLVLVHFQFEPDGRLTSPQVPQRSGRRAALPLPLGEEAIQKFRSQLSEVRTLLDRKKLLELLPASPPAPTPPPAPAWVVAQGPQANPAPRPPRPAPAPISPPRISTPPVLTPGPGPFSPPGPASAVTAQPVIQPSQPQAAPTGTSPPLGVPSSYAANSQPRPQQQPSPQQADIQPNAEFMAQQIGQQAQGLTLNSPFRQTDQQRKVATNRRADLQQNGGKSVAEFDARANLLAANNYSGNPFINAGNLPPGSPQQWSGANFPAVQPSGASYANGSFFNGGVLPPGVDNNAVSANGFDMSGVSMKPLWIGDRLLLARRITAGGQEYVQGCLLDWPGIKAVLQETIADLLPEADFEPVTDGTADVGRMLAALPVRLLPGRLEAAGDGRLSPILLTLAIAWTSMAMAAAAVAGLLAGVIRLSNRRASFVTAVTHELRTPLCTFQMYTEMLAEGMVSEGDQQRQYLATLRGESQRLGHLVENVLSYARLERGRADGRRESLPLGELIGRSVERLRARAAQAGMQLLVEGDDDARKSVVRANPSAVEQILFNLVDNACKYASGGADPRLHLLLAVGREGAEVSLADHGPGVAASVGRRLFRPFSKSAAEAAHSAPGVGLGLCLSRRLARDMGGDLRLAAGPDHGARFVLLLARTPLSLRERGRG